MARRNMSIKACSLPTAYKDNVQTLQYHPMFVGFLVHLSVNIYELFFLNMKYTPDLGLLILLVMNFKL